jgi:hypothetical protein
MNKRNFKTLLTVVLLALASGAALLFGAAAANSQSSVQGLRCEYLSNPLGIDVQKPRLSWLLNPAANVRAQSAYRVLVASAPAILRKDQGDLWDSGRVASTQTTWVEYGGRQLSSGQQAYWKVRVWSEAGRALPWSAQATWSMGLLQVSDWHSRWIGERRPDGTAEGTPLPFPWLRKTFTLTQKPNRAVAYVNPLGYYDWTGQSHIHDTLISIGAWFTEGLAGIRSDGKAPGFQHFIVKPSVVGDLTFVKAKYRSIHGDIVSDWRVENGTFKLSVTVPPGTTATVFVPGEGPVRTQARQSPSGSGNGDLSFEVAPGTYSFETAMRLNR